jgi:hypothetical protein
VYSSYTSGSISIASCLKKLSLNINPLLKHSLTFDLIAPVDVFVLSLVDIVFVALEFTLFLIVFVSNMTF